MPTLIETALDLWPARFVRRVEAAFFDPASGLWSVELECGHVLLGLPAVAERLPCERCTR